MVSGWSLPNQSGDANPQILTTFAVPTILATIQNFCGNSQHPPFFGDKEAWFPFFFPENPSIHQSIRIACRLIDPTFILPAYPWSLGHVETIATRGSRVGASGWAAKESGSHHVCHAHRCEALHGPQGNASRRVGVGSVGNMTWHVACDERYSQLYGHVWICPKWGTENFVMLMEENAKWVDKQPWDPKKTTVSTIYILSFFLQLLETIWFPVPQGSSLGSTVWRSGFAVGCWACCAGGWEQDRRWRVWSQSVEQMLPERTGQAKSMPMHIQWRQKWLGSSSIPNRQVYDTGLIPHYQIHYD
jgi:hypothetical protein